MSGQSEVQDTISQTFVLIEDWLQKSPDSSVKEIYSELKRLRIVIEQEWPLPDIELDKLWLGLYAARNFEDSDPELATLLEHIHYMCKAPKENT